MRLLLYHPHVANRDCQHCLKYQYDEETGEVEKNPSNQEPIERQSEEWAPCRMYAAGKHQKLGPCPKGTPENPNSLTPQNETCYLHYKQCQAVGAFPDDPLVRRHAELIRAIELGFERHQQEIQMTRLLASALGAK